MMSFLFVWQTLIQALLSPPGRDRFFQYASYLHPLGKYGEKAVSGALVIVLVGCSTGGLLTGKSLDANGVIGTTWLIGAGPRISNSRLVSHVCPRPEFFVAILCRAGLGYGQHIYTYWGYYNICHPAGRFASRRKHSTL
jgi:hypothetical protein